MFRARLRARLCRGKEGLHRAPTFVRQIGGYTHILLLFLPSTPVAQLAPRNLLTRWDVSSIPAKRDFSH